MIAISSVHTKQRQRQKLIQLVVSLLASVLDGVFGCTCRFDYEELEQCFYGCEQGVAELGATLLCKNIIKVHMFLATLVSTA